MNVLPLRFYQLWCYSLGFQALNVKISLFFLADDATRVSLALVNRSVFVYS